MLRKKGSGSGGSADSDDSFDDNPDDSYALYDANYSPKMGLNCLFRASACSWQCGGQGFESP